MRATCLKMVYELAKDDPRIVFIGSDLGAGVLDEFKNEMPDRFFMEGVSEAHVIGMAAGLAKEGYIPYVNTIATFLTRRCYEQLAIDLCLHNLPVKLIGNGGGLVYAPLGPTHLAVEDIAIMNALPNMKIVAPVDADEMRSLMPQTIDLQGPLYIRLGKGYDPIISRAEDGFTFGKAIVLRDPGDIVIITTGIMANRALAVADILQGEGVRCGVVHMHTVKPLDGEILCRLAKSTSLIVTLEEHSLIGGLGSSVASHLVDNCPSGIPPLYRLGLPDHFSHHYGSQNSLLDKFGLSVESIAKNISARLTFTSSPLSLENSNV